ncbi:MAG: galactose-1-phosphate uridylyltransferase [Acidobacteriota bacterium]|nr:galactose-1-phosphate uridylyltransferase [Blastocatellia bacterium]MDQ3491118.1 galactose-1-phosphate uridylyltransferase [Acidobacteriota bacterium]
MSELRWHPLLGEWVATATLRQDRTFLPPPDFCPLCPTKPGGFPTEIPESDYDIAVFENRFPSLSPNPPEPAIEGSELYPVEKSYGECEVVVYSPNHSSTLAREPVEQIYKLVQVWTDRYKELSALEFVKYVFIFENKGEAIGVTLHHPHGQIYAYPFVPPRILRELDQSKKHNDETGRCLFCDILKAEQADGRRIVTENGSFTAYIPFFARYPYELHIISRRHLRDLNEMTPEEQMDLAGILKQVLVAFDKLFDISFPYMMVLHQRPSDGEVHNYYHFHIEFYPPLRTATKLKYLAGSETGAGMFINDTLAEDKAAELRNLIETVIWRQ